MAGPSRKNSASSPDRTGASAGRSGKVVAAVADVAAEAGGTLRMRDLVSRSGLTRETIHFYLTQGLLPKPVKTGRNTAVYGEAHVERLLKIRELQERHFLPLKAIRAIFEESAGGVLTEEEESMLQRVRESLPVRPEVQPAGDVPVSRLVPSRVSRADLDTMKRLGLVQVHGRGEAAVLGAEDARILECWSEVRALEKPGDPRFTPDLLAIYHDAIEALVSREVRILSERFAALSGPRAAELVEKSEPILERLLAALRRRRIAAMLAGGRRAVGD